MYSVLLVTALATPVGNADYGSCYSSPSGYACYGCYGGIPGYASWQEPLTVINYGCFSSCYAGYYGCGGQHWNAGYQGCGWGGCHGGNGCAGSPGPRVLYRMPGPITPYGISPLMGHVEESGKIMPPAQTKKQQVKNNSVATNRARLIVEIPEGVELYVDEHKTKSRNSRRTFRTPELKQGQTYFYHFRATVEKDGKKITKATKVNVRAGEVINTSFANWTVVEKNVSTASR